jgi:ubiquinone/menaquinone biosynthesis C-methylase UbiE
MSITLIITALVVCVALAVFMYWQMVIAEGAYLGRRVVTWLYDGYARRYDNVKQFNPATDALMLAGPVLACCPNGHVLDVATGTGRLPAALLTQRRFTGRITGIDASAGMLRIARDKLANYPGRVELQVEDAQALPFPDESFDVVACLEALEFMPDWRRALTEMCRVAKPGALMLLSNRVGPDAWKLPGRALPTPRFITMLNSIGLVNATAHDWLVDYDLVTATKA